MNDEYLSNVYLTLKDINLSGFNKTEDDFKRAMSDRNYAKNVFLTLQDNVRGFAKTEDEFFNASGLGKAAPGSGAGASGGLRLPSNLNKQQVKNYLGKYGASLTDAQYEQIAKEASGKSLDEAVSIANSIATAPVRTQFAPAWQPAKPNDASTPEFNLNTFVAEEVQRPKTGQELGALQESQFNSERQAMATAREQAVNLQPIAEDISENEKSMMSLADDVISGKITQVDLGPIGSFNVGAMEKETGVFTKLKNNPKALYDHLSSYIVSRHKSSKGISEEIVLPYLDSYTSLREIKKQNEAKIQNINTEIDYLSQFPDADPAVVSGLKADLKKEKAIQDMVSPSTSALFDELDVVDKTPIVAKNLGINLLDPFLSLANGLVEEIGVLANPALAPLAQYMKPILKERVAQAKAANEMRRENIQFKELSDQNILDGLNLMNGSRATGQAIGSMGAVFLGGWAAGPMGAAYMGFTLTYGDSLDEARKAGFSEREAQLYATIYGTASAALESFGFKGVSNAFMNTAVKKQVLSTIRSMIASGATKEQILKEVMNKGLRSSVAFLQGAAPEALTEMVQTTAELGTKKGFNLLLADTELGQQGFELPTMEEGLKQIAEAGIIGGFFGGSIPGVKSLTRSKKNEYKNLANSVVKGDVSQESLQNNIKTLVNTGSITQEQGAELLQNIEIALAAKNSLPTYITDDAARERGVELILERNKIAEEMKTSDEDLQDGYKQRLTQIKAELKTISDNKWRAPVDPVIATTVAGLETMTQSLSTHPEPDTAARVFTESLNADRGMLAVLSDAMAAGKEIAMPVIERASAALSALADAFEANPTQTEYTKAAASQAREMADRLSQYTTTVPSVTNGQIPSLSSKEIIGRIKAGVDAGTIDFMENTPEEIAATFSDIMDGKDVSEADAIAVSDFLYGRYKQIMDIRTDLQNKIEEESSPEKKAKLKKSVQAINDVLSRLNADIEASVKYQQEKALQDEAAGTRKKAPLGQPRQEQAPAPTPAQEFDPRNIDQVADDYQQKTGDVLTGVMATALKTVAKLLAKIAPNVKFYVHSTTQEFLDAVKQEGVNEDLSNNAGVVVQNDDGTVESLHINLELALSESTAKAAKYVYHEAAHVLLAVYFRSDKSRGADIGLIFDMAKAIRSALPSKYKGPLAEFVGRYKDKLVYEQEEEFIAELIDMLANDEASLDKPTISKIIAVINDFITAACERFGVDPEKFLLSNNRADLIDFVNSTSRAVKSGLSSDLSEKATTNLQRKYAVQEQATGEVPVQSRTKAGRTAKKSLKPNDLFQINAAPFYRTSLSDYTQAESLHRSMAYNSFLDAFQESASNFNVKIVKITKAIGGWDGQSEVSALFDVEGTWDDVVALATVMGAMAPEVQDSTIAGQVVKPRSKDHEADRWDIEVDDPSIAFSAIREVSFEQDGYTISGNTIILLDFGKGGSEFIEKTLTLINTIEQYGGQIKSREKKAIKSDLIEDKDGRRQETIERLKKSAIQREGDRGPFYNFLEKANERLDAFIKYKKIEVSPEAAEVDRLRKEQMESLVTGEEMSQEKVDRLNEVSDSVVEKLIPIFAIDQSLYSKAKEEIEAIAQDAIDILSGMFGFVSEFGIKKPARAAVKTVRWYNSMPTRLGDGARTNIIVNTEPDADFIFDMMSAKFTDDLRRRERPEEGTELGYPKRLIEIMTKSGKLAEVQVMTPRGYLAKDGAAEFPVDQIQYAVDYLNQIRDILGWQIPDGVGHYFYEIHRDPQTPKKLRDEAEVISKEYYKAMLRPEQSTLTDQQFRDAISEFKAKVDAADKSKWDRGNLGIAPSSLNDYLDNKPAKTTEQYVKEKEAKEKERQPGKKIKSGLVGEVAQLGQDIRDNLQVARDMEASKKDAKTIRLATGWERGKDDKWRYEIPDGKLVSDKNIWKLEEPGKAIFVGDLSKKNPATLDAIIDNPELFRLYPQLKDIKVDGVWSKNGSVAGVYIPASKTIKFSSPTKESARSIILHEIQHAIQDIEGFAMGGNPSQISTPNQALQRMASVFNLPKLSKEQKAIAKEKTKERGLRFSEVFFFDVIKDDPYILEEVIERLEILNEVSPNEIYQKLIEGVDLKIMEMGGENVAVQKYKKLAGEVEARNVQKRAEYTPEQRREITLQETEDVAREDQVVIFGVDETPAPGKKTKAGRTRAGSFKNGYDPNEAADRGNQEDRDLQKRIYDAALEVWDSTKDLMDLSADIYEAVSDKLGIGLNPIHIGELVKDLRTGNRPEYSKNQEGKYKRSNTRQREGSVMTSALEALERLATDRRVNKGIIASLKKALKGGPQYTVEGQMDIESIADALFDIFGGSTNLTALQELYNIAEMTKGGLRSFMFARVANDAWNKARESKDQQEKLEYRNIGNRAIMQLGQEATEAGRFNAMIYRIQKLNPEFLAAYQKTQLREETESQMRSSGKKKSNVASATAALNTAQTEASEQAANSPSVQAAINTATGTPPSTSTPPPAPKSKPGAPKPPAPKPAPAANKVVDDRIKELKGKLKDIFSGKKTKPARVLPASMNPEILDIITELARNYIKKGMTDRAALISKINGDVTAAGGSITMDYFTEMWNDVQGEAVQQRNSAAADSLANRIVGKVKGAIRTSTKTFDPIAELITDLVNKGTEDVETPKRSKESPLEKIKRLLVEFDSAKKIWEASKAKVEAKIDGLDPARFTQSEKAEMKAMLDNFFANDLSYFEIKKTSTPSPDATVRNAIKQEMKDKKLKIEEILLTANSKKAETRDQFIQNIVDDIVYSTGISYNQAIKIAEDFTRKYDEIVTKKQESILKRFSNPMRVRNIKKKSQGQRAFEMIKYGALDPSIEIHDKDGNIIDSAMLLAEIFGVPYLDQEARDMLDGFAEVIADTPEGIIRQQVINDMMMSMKMHQYRQLGSLGDRIMSQFYANLLTSTDTLMKAFNSNVLMNPFEYLSIATRAAVKGDFALIPLLTRGFYQQKGVGSVKELKATKAMSDVDGYVINQGESYYLFNDKTIMSLANPKAVALSSYYEGLLRYSASMNQARGVLENIVMHENFTNNVTGAVYEKHAKSRAGRVWGKYVTFAQKRLGALDALATAGATDARYSDLLFDAIRHYAKINGQKIKGSEIVKIINLLKGYSPMVQLDAYNQAITEMEIVEDGKVDLSDRKKKTLLLLRVEEIVREKMKDRYQQAVNENPWLSSLDQQEIADMLDQAKEISTKIGLMGKPPGTGGILSHILSIPGRTFRFANMQVGTFLNAPINATMFLIQGNTPIGALITGIRLLKSERGVGLGVNEFFQKEGIRFEMYGKTSAEIPLFKNTSIKWNLEKQDLLTKFVLIQAPVITMTYMAGNAVMIALASMFDDDEDRDKLLKDGIEFLRTVPQKDRELMFFGDPLSPDAKKKAGVWRSLPFYTTGAMYGYQNGGYGKMQSLRARFGIEPYTVYSYGKKVFSYKDNPLLGAFFMEMAAATDAILFNDSADIEDTQLGLIMMSSWSQMNLLRDQSNLRSISEITELFAGQRAYEGLDDWTQRRDVYLGKSAANILSNLTIPAEMKNINQDVMAIMGQYMDDPKQFHEFIVYRWPIIGSAVIEGDKTGPFGYPLKMQPKRVFPIGTEQFKLPLMLDGTLDVPTIDQLLSTEDAQYTALFERNKNDKFLKPGISGYYKLNKYGDYERETFTLEEQKKIREEYKLIMREFAEKNIGLTQSPEEFDTRLGLFLGLYGIETGKNRVQTMGYKRYIVNKVMGSKANDILLDAADGLINMNKDQMLIDKIKETEEGFEPLPR
jgi:hypothetical protein